MKERTLKELLQIVLEEYLKDDVSIPLCYFSDDLNNSSIISLSERGYLIDLFSNDARKSEWHKKNNVIYLFDPSDKDSRIEYLINKIESL